MRYNSRRSRPAIRSRMTGRSVEPPRREGQGLVLLMAQTVLCVAALAAVFTMQYVKPREYKIMGSGHIPSAGLGISIPGSTWRLPLARKSIRYMQVW